MKVGNKVMVNWPAGKDGPYEVRDTDAGPYILLLHIDGDLYWIDATLCEVIEPIFTPRRLCYVWDDDAPNYKDAPAYRFRDIKIKYDHIEPVHRQWQDLSDEERDDWSNLRRNYEDFAKAYKLITREKHPGRS